MNFTDFFDRVVVISREDRPHRRTRCQDHLAALGLEKGVEWFPAVVGRPETMPAGWSVGVGAWGCLQSHLAIMEQARTDKLSSVLVLEDDVVFTPHIHRALPEFMRALPRRWHQLYLGGQHLIAPERTGSPLVHRVRNVNRTHAYAVHGDALPLIHKHLRGMIRYQRGWNGHVDARMGFAHERLKWETFAPSWWLAGQAACVSDVWEGRPLPERWWHPPGFALRLPYVVVRARGELPFAAHECLLFGDADCLPGRHRSTLTACLRADALLCRWLHMHAAQALVFARLPAWEGDPQRLRSLWPAGAVDAAATDLRRLSEYPFNRLFVHPFAPPVG